MDALVMCVSLILIMIVSTPQSEKLPGQRDEKTNTEIYSLALSALLLIYATQEKQQSAVVQRSKHDFLLLTNHTLALCAPAAELRVSVYLYFRH
jgi:hypothetical protein